MFAQLGARGASVVFSSGDGGVGAGTCETNDGTNRVLFQPVSFRPGYPVSICFDVLGVRYSQPHARSSLVYVISEIH